MNKKVIAIDPGNEQSALVVWDGEKVEFMVKEPNDYILKLLYNLNKEPLDLAIERYASYGMSVGQTSFDTCEWSGRFIQKFEETRYCKEQKIVRVFRREVKLHHCGHVNAKDNNIIQALVDRFEPNMRHGKYGKGTKNNPGLFYGFSEDIWQAFALAVYYYDTYIKN